MLFEVRKGKRVLHFLAGGAGRRVVPTSLGKYKCNAKIGTPRVENKCGKSEMLSDFRSEYACLFDYNVCGDDSSHRRERIYH